MIDTVVILGDSYTYGHGCKDRIFYRDPNTKQIVGKRTPYDFPSEYCWPSLLQKEYDIEVINLARCGHSNPSMFRDLINYGIQNKSTKKTLIFFAGTSPNRLEAGGANGELHSWVLAHDWDPSFNDKMEPHIEQYHLAKKMYVTHLYQDLIGQNIGLMSLLGAKEYAELRGFDFLYSIPTYWYDSKIIQHLHNNTPLAEKMFQDIQSYDYSGSKNNWINQNVYKCVDNHTNEKGHEVYYNKIIKPLIEKYK